MTRQPQAKRKIEGSSAKKGKPKKKRQVLPVPVSEIEETIPLANSFDALSEFEDDMETITRTEPPAVEKREKVPPIVVTTVTDLASFRKQLSNHEATRNLKVSFQVGQRGQCRVLTESSQDHATICAYLKAHLHKFYTFDTKSARPFKVVMKGLSSDNTPEEIKNELQVLLGFAPSQVIQMKKKSNENNNSRFGLTQQFYLIHFNRSDVNNLKCFEKVQFLFHVRVKWEHYRRHGGQNITQCRRCQAFGHGTDHCNMDPKCMNCGSLSHVKDNCPVKENTAFQCANCNENHKSNYWECPIRKKVLEARAKHQPKGRKISPTQALTIPVNVSQTLNVPVSSQVRKTASSSIAGISYTDVVVGKSNSNGNSPNNRTNVPQAEVSKISTRNFSANIAPDNDLGDVTPENLEFLQNSLFELIQKMSKANSMAEAIQTGLAFANKIVFALKFNNGSN